MISENQTKTNYGPRQVLTQIFRRSNKYIHIAPHFANVSMGPVKASSEGVKRKGEMRDPVTPHCSSGQEPFVTTGALGRILIYKNVIKETGICPARGD